MELHEPGHQLLGHLELRLGRGDPRVGVVGLGLWTGKGLSTSQVNGTPQVRVLREQVVEDRGAGARADLVMTMGCLMLLGGL